ncbi:hypothetical protein IU486_07725 [Streptomyces gardneri]|uniref:hypothetical protein n=1 Tax=Nocardia sputi TaxID=2943705 RepID=UPI0018948D8C|nr:hypothetical protein [Nocardia sputi]MBF6164662.1 hypothetical protein [Streptomyces gardneri]
MEMHPMLMPDRQAIANGNYPRELVYSKFTESIFKDLWNNFDDIYKSFGKNATEDPPAAPQVPQVAPSGAIGSFQDYAIVAVKLRNAWTTLHTSSSNLVTSVRESKKWSNRGQVAINSVIDTKIVALAPTVPPQGIRIDDYIWNWVADAGSSAATEVDKVSEGQRGVAGTIDDQTKMIEDLKKQIKDLEAAQKNPALNPPPIDTWTPGIQQPPNPPSTDSLLPPGLDGLDGLDNPDNSGLTPPDLGDPGTDLPGVNTPGGVDGIGNIPGATPTTPIPPSTPATSPMGSGMDMMSSMLPMMMQQAMMRNMADQDLNNRRAELDPHRFDDELAPVPPPPVTAPVTAQPASVQPATTAPATQHSGAPAGTAPSTQPAVAPGRTPEADGSVIYTFPDGRTQKVSAMVAQALDAAFGNASGTDAQKAYEKTPAKWSDKKQIGDRVDPYQLMTGDVATWDKGTAILVVFGSEEGGTLEAVINGELKPFTPEMSDSGGEFGQFSGFVHPKGIELTAPADKGAPPATPGAADQPANAAMPVVAAG